MSVWHSSSSRSCRRLQRHGRRLQRWACGGIDFEGGKGEAIHPLNAGYASKDAGCTEAISCIRPLTFMSDPRARDWMLSTDFMQLL